MRNTSRSLTVVSGRVSVADDFQRDVTARAVRCVNS